MQKFSVVGYSYVHKNHSDYKLIVSAEHYPERPKEQQLRVGIWVTQVEDKVDGTNRATSGLLELDAAEEYAVRLLYLVKEARGELDG